MLKLEDLKKIEGADKLEDALLQRIAAASAADENAVIAAKTSEIYGGIDSDISGIVGTTKPQGMKTFDWVKDIAKKAKEAGNATELQTKITEKEAEITALKKTIADGTGDANVKKQLEDKTRQYDDLQKQFEDTKADLEKKIKDNQEESFNYKVDKEFTLPSDLKFKEGLDQGVIDVFLENAKTKARAKGTPVFENIGGKDVLTFRDENNQRLNNPNNSNNAFTAQELLMAELSPILAENKKKPGTGTGESAKGGSGGGGSDFVASDATSKVDFNTKVEKHLLANGHAKSDGDWFDKVNAIVAENKDAYSALPMQTPTT